MTPPSLAKAARAYLDCTEDPDCNADVEREAKDALRATLDAQPKHDWRLPEDDEPREEGAVCRRCGRYANSEGDQPCDPTTLGALPTAGAAAPLSEPVPRWEDTEGFWQATREALDEADARRLASISMQEHPRERSPKCGWYHDQQFLLRLIREDRARIAELEVEYNRKLDREVSLSNRLITAMGEHKTLQARIAELERELLLSKQSVGDFRRACERAQAERDALRAKLAEIADMEGQEGMPAKGSLREALGAEK